MSPRLPSLRIYSAKRSSNSGKRHDMRYGRAAYVGIAVLFSICLAACGGGGGGGDSPPAVSAATAEGVYGGTLTGSSSSAFQLLILENGDFWALYGTQTATAFGVAGFVQGSGTSNNGTYVSSNTKDFGFNPAVAGVTNATYNATNKTISGTVANPGGTVTFSGGPIAGSLYNYNAPASLSTVAGAWSTTALTGETVAI